MAGSSLVMVGRRRGGRFVVRRRERASYRSVYQRGGRAATTGAAGPAWGPIVGTGETRLTSWPSGSMRARFPLTIKSGVPTRRLNRCLW